MQVLILPYTFYDRIDSCKKILNLNVNANYFLASGKPTKTLIPIYRSVISETLWVAL